MPRNLVIRSTKPQVPVKKRPGARKQAKVKNVPEADNLMSSEERKLLRIQYGYTNVCSFCNFQGNNSTEVALHVGYGCRLPLTNQMVFKMSEQKQKGSSRSQHPGTPMEYLYLWLGPSPKGKPRRSSDMRIKGTRGKDRINNFKRDVAEGMKEGSLDFVGVPVCFYPAQRWHKLIGMTHSAMIVIKIRHEINGTVQASYYDSFQTERSTMFCNR
ncbi:unnamed protein product, partial [Allacma fusca]